MEPVMAVAVVTAVIGAAGTVLAAWVQGRARPPSGWEALRATQSAHVPYGCRDVGIGGQIIAEIGVMPNQEAPADERR
jgi:hypothetical protein